MTQALELLKSHRFFRILPLNQVEALLEYCQVLEYPEGSVIFYQNEQVSSLLLVMEGCLLFGGESAFGGNTLFLSHLALPEKIPNSLKVREKSRVILLEREAFLSWLDRFPKASKRLGSVKRFREEGGFPAAFWRDYGVLLPQKSRRSGGQKPLLVLREWWFLWFLRQWWIWGGAIVTAGFQGSRSFVWFWLLPGVIVLLIRRANGLFITSRALIGRIFRVKGMNRHAMKIPLEQIQAVERHRKGILQAILGLNSLSLKTSTMEGSVSVRNLRRSARAEELLSKLRVGEESRRDLMTALKEARQRKLQDKAAPELLYQGPRTAVKADLPGEYRFRKSLYALVKRTFLPFLLFCFLGALFFLPFLSGPWAFLAGLLSLFPASVMLYRWQDWRNDLFKVEGDRVYDVDRKPLGKEMTRRQVALESIENITARQKGLFPLLFNSGDVKVILPGNTSEFVFEDVSDPWYVQDQLLRLRWMELERKKDKESRIREEELLTLADLLTQELLEKSRS